MTNLTVVAKITAKAGKSDVVYSELKNLIEPTCTKDAGCVSYVLYRDQNDPAVFFFLETWENKELLDRHLDSEHFKVFAKATADTVAKSEVHLLTKAG